MTAVKDGHAYPTGIKVSDAETDVLNISRDTFRGEWKCTIRQQSQLLAAPASPRLHAHRRCLSSPASLSLPPELEQDFAFGNLRRPASGFGHVLPNPFGRDPT